MAKKKRKPRKATGLMYKNSVELDIREGRKIKANIAAWSEKNRGSYDYYEEYFYEDRTYKCRKCVERAVYTAKEQQYALEVRKRYLWQDRVLCRSCFPKWNRLKGELQRFKERWSAEKDVLRNDLSFLSEWLIAYREYHSYEVGRLDWALSRMLEKKLEKLHGAQNTV